MSDGLRVGDRVRYDGSSWRIVAFDGPRVRLADPGRDDVTVPVTGLVSAPDFAVLEGSPARQPLTRNARFDELPDTVRQNALWWQRHLVDVITGRPFDGAGPNFDPRLTSMRQREQAKVQQLAEDGHRVALNSLQRQRLRYQKSGLIGLVDQRLLRPALAGARVHPDVRSALSEVLAANTHRSSGTLDRIRRDLIALLRERHGVDHGLVIPSISTLRRMIIQAPNGHHATGSARTRRTLAQQPQRRFSAIHPARPGEYVEVDSTPLDIAVVLDDGVIGRVELSGMVDVATRTLMAQVLRPSTKAVDVASLLAHALTPEPMRPGWAETLRMSYSALPFQVLSCVDKRLENAAARPVIVPETIVMDHGRAYMSRALQHACRTLGISIQPAHEDAPTDKPHIERTLQSVGTLFAQHVRGYLGSSVERRGRNAEQDAAFSIVELQQLLDEWVVTGWQNRRHEGLRDPLATGKMLTPNEMYAAMVSIAGHVPVPLSAEDYVELQPVVHRVIGSEGIRVDHRSYDCAALNPYRRQRSGDTRNGGRWTVHYDPYDVTRIWVRLPEGITMVPWRRLLAAPSPFGADIWRQSQEVLRDRGVDRPTEAQIHAAVDDLLERAHNPAKGTPAKHSRKAKRARARDTAARQARNARPSAADQPAPAPPDPEPTVAAAAEATPTTDDAGDAGDAGDARVIPLPIYDAEREATTWW